MRIRKISQSAATPGKIVNSPSDSTTETYSCNYTKDISAIVSPTEPTGNNKNKIWFKKGKNLFNGLEVGGLDGTDGSTIQSTKRLRSKNLVPVNSSTQYVAKVFQYNTTKGAPKINVLQYDANGGFIISTGWKDNPYTFITPSTCKYIKLLFYLSNSTEQELTVNDISQVQVEQGSTATDYEEYVEPEIYTRNNNNVYEEFTTKDYDVLWSNSNPSASFAGQTVTLNKSINEYSYYEVLFKDYYGENSCISTGKIKIMKTYLESCRYRNQVRELTSISDTSATFGDGLIYQNYGSNTATTNNNINIPLEIIGYK